jgi:hypothetical protein
VKNRNQTGTTANDQGRLRGTLVKVTADMRDGELPELEAKKGMRLFVCADWPRPYSLFPEGRRRPHEVSAPLQ